MRKSIQIILQNILLAAFILLIFKGKVQLWMAVFLLGVVVSFVLGRVYCGWICPINSMMKLLNPVKKRLKIKNRPIPRWLANPWTRTIALVLFLGLAVFANVSHKPLPVLPLLFVIGVLLTLIYPELLWHRYLCPYGSILRFPARLSRYQMQIDPAACSNCGACTRVCPTAAIENPNGQHQIVKDECLVCMACQDRCPKGAIKYK